MFEGIIVTLAALAIGAAFVLALAFVALGATRLDNEETPSRFASPGLARAWDSARVAAGVPARGGFVDGLVRGLMSARAAIQGAVRNATFRV